MKTSENFQNIETVSNDFRKSDVKKQVRFRLNKDKSRTQKSSVDQEHISISKKSESISSKRDHIKKKSKRFKKLIFKNLTIKNRKNLEKFIKTKLKKKMKMKIASSKNEEPIIIKIENEKIKTEHIIRYLHSYSRFIIKRNAETIELMTISDKSIKPKTDAETVKM